MLARNDFKYRNSVAFFMYFTTLFSGGLIPWYILIVKYLDWKDSYLAMLIPALISAWNIILMKNFMKSIPDSIVESARIDGANDFTIYSRLILPLSTPGLATIGLFLCSWLLERLVYRQHLHHDGKQVSAAVLLIQDSSECRCTAYGHRGEFGCRQFQSPCRDAEDGCCRRRYRADRASISICAKVLRQRTDDRCSQRLEPVPRLT